MKKTYAKLMTAVMAAASILPAVPTAADETAESTLNVAVGAQFTTFDPALNTETANNYVLNHLYAGMFQQGMQMEKFIMNCAKAMRFQMMV